MHNSSDTKTKTELSSRSHILFDKLVTIDQLDDLITFTCSILNASLLIRDKDGLIFAHSPLDPNACSYWRKCVQNGRINKHIVTPLQVLRPISTTMHEDQCGENKCTRLIFPLNTEDDSPSYYLSVFFWDRLPNYEDQCFAAILAGSFSSIISRGLHTENNLHIRRIRLLKKLLDYRPEIKDYYTSSIEKEGFSSFSLAYQLVIIPLDSVPKSKEHVISSTLYHIFDSAWCFNYKNHLIIVYNTAILSTERLKLLLLPFLATHDLYGCLSIPFYDLLKIRRIFEDCCAAFQISTAKSPAVRLHLALQHQFLIFLSRCQQYFPLQDYYPEGLTRLMEYDRETGRNYLATLTAYLENNMNANAASKSIFMHRNTMMQQIEKIEQIMGVSLEDKEMCLYLHLCLKIHELLEL